MPVQTPQMRSVKAQASRGIAALQDHFEPAPHGAGGDRVADDTFVIHIHFAAHVAFDPGDRVDDDALAGIVEVKTVWGRNHGLCLLFVRLGFAFALRGFERRDSRVNGNGPANDAGGGHADLVGIGFDPELGQVGHAVIEGALIPEPVFGTADTAVTGLDREADVPSFQRMVEQAL